MSDHGMPEGWRSLLVAILWVIFAFAFGHEAVVNFNDWLLGHGPSYEFVATFDALICLLVSGIALLLWKGRGILPARFLVSANNAAENAYVWITVLLVIFVFFGLPHFLTLWPPAASIQTQGSAQLSDLVMAQVKVPWMMVNCGILTMPPGNTRAFLSIAAIIVPTIFGTTLKPLRLLRRF
jgi:hypothetical protein